MPRYIDAEKAEKVFKDIFCKNCNSYTGIRCFCCYMRDGADIYADMPTEDVQPVVHARWEISSDGYYPYCKKCNARPENGKMTKYCPNCGAKMDGD